jgi:hypothetical protein
MTEHRLSQFLKTEPDWGRMKTTMPGLFILKLPAYRSTPAIIAVDRPGFGLSGFPALLLHTFLVQLLFLLAQDLSPKSEYSLLLKTSSPLDVFLEGNFQLYSIPL